MRTEAPVRTPMFVHPGSARLGVEWAAAILVGCSVVALLVLVDGGGTKPLVVIGGGLLAVSGMVCLRTWPHWLSGSILLGLAATLSISLKFHPVFRTEHLGGAIGLRVSATELLLALLLALATPAAMRKGVAVVRLDPVVSVAAGAYLVWALVSTLASDDAVLGIFQLSAVVQALVIGVVLASYEWRRRARQIFVAGLLCGLLLQSGAAIVQTVRPGLLAFDFLGASEDLGDDDGAAVRDVDLGTTTIAGAVATRPTGLLIHPNVLGAYFVLTIPLAIAVWLTGVARWERLLALAAGALSAAALYLSLSRSAWVGTAFAVSLGALLVWRWGLVRLGVLQKIALAAAVVLMLAGLAMKADRIYLRLFETAGDAMEFRRDLALTAWAMVKDHSVAGAGLNTFIYRAEQYDASGTSRLKRFPVHNAYLLELAETGFPGGLAFLAMVVAMVIRSVSWSRRTSPEARLVVLALACGIAGFWITQIFDYVYRIPILTSLVWAHVGLALGLAAERPA